MSPDKQRIAIAEACGWTWEPFGDGSYCWNSPGPSKRIFYSQPPDYLNDLNAMHEAEKMLGSFEMPMEDGTLPAEYWDYLCEVSTCYVNATAAQRAEAFLKTIGKWEEEKP